MATLQETTCAFLLELPVDGHRGVHDVCGLCITLKQDVGRLYSIGCDLAVEDRLLLYLLLNVAEFPGPW